MNLWEFMSVTEGFRSFHNPGDQTNAPSDEDLESAMERYGVEKRHVDDFNIGDDEPEE